MGGRMKRRAVVGVVAAAVLLAGGIAYATIPDGNGVIHGCYAKSGGSLRVIDAGVTNCKSTETSLDWNVQGQQGPQGPAGPQGPSGTSHGYLSSSSGKAVGFAPAFANIVSYNELPSGNYMISTEVQLGANSEPIVECEILVNGSVVPNTMTGMILKSGAGVLPIVSAATLSGGGSTLEVDCNSTDSNTFANGNLSLIAVDALN